MPTSAKNLTVGIPEQLTPSVQEFEAAERRQSSRPDEEEAILGKFGPGSLPERQYPQLSNLTKRAVDIAASLVGIILLLPVFVLIGLLIRLSSKGPIFFVQNRVGVSGKIFKMYKFRTMVVNAEELKKNLMNQNEMSGPVFKIKQDPRVTRVGRFLRKTSLDELPQLFNVLLNDMSLVGPRPPLMDEVIKYRKWQARRLSVKPGITCIWQVSGRNQISFEEWVRMDIRYIEKRSILFDLLLLVKTIKVVFIRPDGT